MKDPRLTTFLWFESGLDEALELYAQLVSDFEVKSRNLNPANKQLFVAEFSMLGQDFIGMCIPGGEKFNTSISLSLQVDGQDEVDRIWNLITAQGEEGRCGWCKDKFGVSWQVIPYQMQEHLGNPDPEKSLYANSQLMRMNKIIIAELAQ